MPAIYITGMAISGLFIFFILTKKQTRFADYLLIAINLLLCGFLLLDWLVKERITVTRFFLQTSIPYLIFPIYFVFALESMQERNYQQLRWWLFFVPFVLSVGFLTADMFFLRTYDQQALEQLYNDPPLSYQIIYKGNQIYFLITLCWLLSRLKKYAQEIKDRFSFTDPIQLDWLTNTTWVYLAVQVVSMSVFLASNFNLFPIDIRAAYSVVGVSIVMSIFYVSFHGIRQYSIAHYYGTQIPRASPVTSPAGPETEPESAFSKEKYKSSSLSAEEQAVIYDRLLALFAEKSLYLEPKLQLQEVADELQVTTHHLSQTINSIQGQPFYDFVNAYRVRHLQKLLADPAQKRFTILALGLESGFNSKASLNRVFKQETGLSPKEYQILHLAD